MFNESTLQNTLIKNASHTETCKHTTVMLLSRGWN